MTLTLETLSAIYLLGHPSRHSPTIGPAHYASPVRRTLNPARNRDMYEKKTMTGTNVRSLL